MVVVVVNVEVVVALKDEDAITVEAILAKEVE